MTLVMRAIETDVLVVGGGAAGIAAAVAARSNGAEVILVEAGPMLGGELILGLPVEGLYTADGTQTVAGFATTFLKTCANYGSDTAPVSDFCARTMVCLDPEAIKLAAIELTQGAGIKVLMYTLADKVTMDDGGRVSGVILRNKGGRTLVRAKVVIDATSSGHIASLSGCDKLESAKTKQPGALIFRMAGVNAADFLDFVAETPATLAAPMNAALAPDRATAAAQLKIQGRAVAVFDRQAPVLRNAIAAKRMIPTESLSLSPTSVERRDVVIRVDLPQSADPNALDFASDVETCMQFLQTSVPGFAGAVISAVYPGTDTGPSRPVRGKHVLCDADIVARRGFDDAVALGTRTAVSLDNGVFDIPFGCLLPQGMRNLLVVGGALSIVASSGADARATGTDMALGEAAGTAAALGAAGPERDLHDLDIRGLRHKLRQQGAILECAE